MMFAIIFRDLEIMSISNVSTVSRIFDVAQASTKGFDGFVG